MTEEETREQIKKRLAALRLHAETLEIEALLKDAPAISGERRAEGRSCACWNGKLCQFHNLMYHGRRSS